MIGSPMDALLSDPWGTLDGLVDGPLHPGGTAATRSLLDDAGVGEHTRLLDVGCGSGGAVSLARDRGAQAVGLDRTPGTRRAIRGEMDAIPVQTNSVDVALAECALCLAEDFGTAVAETARVLRPDGRLALSDVVVEQSVNLPEPIAQLLCLTGTRDRDRITTTLREAGFEIRQLTDHGDDLLSMRDRIENAIDYERLLRATGEAELLAGIERVEQNVRDGTIGYLSVIAEPA